MHLNNASDSVYMSLELRKHFPSICGPSWLNILITQ